MNRLGLRKLYFVVISALWVSNISAMENFAGEDSIQSSSRIFVSFPNDVKVEICKNFSSITDLNNYLTINKDHHEFGKKTNWDSLITINGISEIVIKKELSDPEKLIAAKYAYVFQNNILRLNRGLSVDINLKKRGQVTIESRLEIDEIVSILSKLPMKYVRCLSPSMQWVHWCAYAPLLADMCFPLNRSLFVKTAELLDCENNDNLSNSTMNSKWQYNLGKFALRHAKAGFMYTLFFSHFPGQMSIIFEAKYPSKRGCEEAWTVKKFDGPSYAFLPRFQKYVWYCYDKAIMENIPTAQSEYDSFNRRLMYPRIDLQS